MPGPPPLFLSEEGSGKLKAVKKHNKAIEFNDSGHGEYIYIVIFMGFRIQEIQ